MTTATKVQRERFRNLKELGCIACRKEGFWLAHPEIHHIVEGYRLGHDATIPLCPWHHRGEHHFGKKAAKELYGPSLHDEKKQFIARYGTEKKLLEETNQWLKGVAPRELKVRLAKGSSLPF